MKKSLTGLLLGLLLLPGVVSAQIVEEPKVETWSPEQELVIKALQSQLIQLIEQLLALLMQQQQQMTAQYTEVSGAIEELAKPDGIHVDIGELSCSNARYNLAVAIEGDYQGGYYQMLNEAGHLIKGGYLEQNQLDGSVSFTNSDGYYVGYYTLNLYDKAPMVTQKGLKVFNSNPVVTETEEFRLGGCN